MKNRNQIATLNKKLEQKSAEFREFIYRTAHDVKGPVATIRGLTNVAILENKSAELNIYLDMISKVANRLDLILEYLNESTCNVDNSQTQFGITDLIDNMINRLNTLKNLYDLNFEISSSYRGANFVVDNNPAQIYCLAENLLLILTSSRYLFNLNYSIALKAEDNGICMEVVYQDVDISFVKSAIEQLSNDGSNKNSRIGYNNMRINIVNRCINVTGSSIITEEEGNSSIIKILIPSMVIN